MRDETLAKWRDDCCFMYTSVATRDRGMYEGLAQALAVASRRRSSRVVERLLRLRLHHRAKTEDGRTKTGRSMRGLRWAVEHMKELRLRERQLKLPGIE